MCITLTFATTSLFIALQIREIAKNLPCIKFTNIIQIHMIFLYQVLHGTNYFFVYNQQFFFVISILSIIYQLENRILQVSHSIDGGLRIGILKVFIFRGGDAPYML